MGTFPRRCVADASVLIDLYNGGILSLLSRMPFEVVVPDVIVAEELLSIDVRWFRRQGVRIQGLPPTQVVEVFALAQFHRSVSANDLFAYVLARNLDAVLLTGDGALRKFAEREGLVVHGTLWVLEGMVTLGHLKPADALTALDHMLTTRSRFPQHEVSRLKKMWEG